MTGKATGSNASLTRSFMVAPRYVIVAGPLLVCIVLVSILGVVSLHPVTPAARLAASTPVKTQRRTMSPIRIMIVPSSSTDCSFSGIWTMIYI